MRIFHTEWLKLRRCQILLVGVVALALCPLVQYGTQLIIEPELRDPNYDFTHLCANVVWGNTQIFLPISLVMIGGWLIDRENAQDTAKNLLTVPLRMPALLGAKLLVVECLALAFGLYSCAATLLAGAVFDLPGLTLEAALPGFAQIVAAACTTGLVCLPPALLFGQLRGAYLAGSIATFFLGYSILFFKSGFLLSFYPFSAALILAGFDMQEYNGATTQPQPLLSAAGLLFTLAVTALLLASSERWSRRAARPRRAKAKKRGRPARR